MGRLKPGFRDEFPRFVHAQELMNQDQKDKSSCLGLEIVVVVVTGTEVACLEQEMTRVWGEKEQAKLEGVGATCRHARATTLRSHKKRPRHEGIFCNLGARA